MIVSFSHFQSFVHCRRHFVSFFQEEVINIDFLLILWCVLEGNGRGEVKNYLEESPSC